MEAVLCFPVFFQSGTYRKRLRESMKFQRLCVKFNASKVIECCVCEK